MTVIAAIAANNMCRVFAGRRNAIVAGAACAYDLGVVDDHHWHKNIRGVAVFAHIRRLNVCRTFTRCIRAVVAANTIARDVYVIEICR